MEPSQPPHPWSSSEDDKMDENPLPSDEANLQKSTPLQQEIDPIAQEIIPVADPIDGDDKEEQEIDDHGEDDDDSDLVLEDGDGSSLATGGGGPKPPVPINGSQEDIPQQPPAIEANQNPQAIENHPADAQNLVPNNEADIVVENPNPGDNNGVGLVNLAEERVNNNEDNLYAAFFVLGQEINDINQALYDSVFGSGGEEEEDEYSSSDEFDIWSEHVPANDIDVPDQDNDDDGPRD